VNIFKVIGHFFENLYHLFGVPGQVDTAEGILAEVQSHIPAAMNAVQTIENLLPNRATETILAVATKYGLQAGPGMGVTELETILQNAALAELQKVAAGVKNHILRSAIGIAVNLWKASRAG